MVQTAKASPKRLVAQGTKAEPNKGVAQGGEMAEPKVRIVFFCHEGSGGAGQRFSQEPYMSALFWIYSWFQKVQTRVRDEITGALEAGEDGDWALLSAVHEVAEGCARAESEGASSLGADEAAAPVVVHTRRREQGGGKNQRSRREGCGGGGVRPWNAWALKAKVTAVGGPARRDPTLQRS